MAVRSEPAAPRLVNLNEQLFGRGELSAGQRGRRGRLANGKRSPIRGLTLRLDFDFDALAAELLGVVAHARGPHGGVHREDELTRG